MILLLLLIIGSPQKQIDKEPIIYDAASSLYASEFTFISTPLGIYTFDRNSKTWGRITQANGLPDNIIKIIGLDEGIIWVVTAEGLASADVRINDWQIYDLAGKIEGLGFDEDYVWLGGDFGLKRFDKYAETWEDISDLEINDMFSDKDYIWIAADSALVRYNRQFEKIEEIPAAPKHSYFHIINTNSTIWFIADNYFVAYDKDNESWTEYKAFRIRDYSSFGDSLFIVSEGNVYYYDPSINNWQKFRDIEGLDNVNGISACGENILFATNNGLILYNWNKKTRKLYNRTNGLEKDSLIGAYEESNFTFVVSQYDIEWLDKATGIWQVEELVPTGEKRERFFYVDGAGLNMKLINDVDLRLQGITYYSETRTFTDSVASLSDYENINLKLIGHHNSGRLFSLYYDDTDKEKVMSGFGYRGLNQDFLYRCNGGYLESEYYKFDLIPRFSTLGGSAKFRYKTHSLNLQGGKLKSKLRNDFFYGKSTKKEHNIFDIHYQRNTFYYIYPMQQKIKKGYDTLFVDDGYSSTNKIDTRTDYTIGGITGDFDPLINGIDYFIDYNRGAIHILNPRLNSDTIVLLLNGKEIIIQSESIIGHLMENVYFFGQNITPNSLTLTITDTLGQVCELTEFGIDNNYDNSVDAEFINYDLGYLTFPEDRPFPDEVYDDTVHVYTMAIVFLSQSVFYYLSHRPILFGSEKVYVDGKLTTRGTDYVVDYTSGVLLFLQEDVVSDYSEIEVQYSSEEREREDKFYSAQPNIEVGNHITVAPGVSIIDQEKIFHLSGELRTGKGDENSMKLIPQVATNSENDWAQDHSLIAHYEIFSLSTEYKGFSEGFESFGANEKKYGRIKRSGAVLIGIKPHYYVGLEGRFKKEYQQDTLNSQHTVQYTYGKINYMNPNLPNGYVLLGKDILPDYDKSIVQVNANYNFELFESKIRLSSVVRNEIINLDESNMDKGIEYILNTGFSLLIPVSGDLYFRHNDLYANDETEKKEEEIRAALNIDVVPGLNYIGNYELETTSFFLDLSKDISLRHYFYNNLNVAPGRWYSHLSIINFSLGLGNSFDEYVNNLSSSYRRPTVIFSPIKTASISSINKIRSYYINVQFMPFSNFLIWATRTLNKSGKAKYSMPDLKSTYLDEIRIEYDPGDLGLFTTSLEQRKYHTYPLHTIQNIYFEWSKPWNVNLRTKLDTNFRLDKNDYGTVSSENSEAQVDFETLFRFGSKSYINLSLRGIRQDNYQTGIDYSITSGAGLYLNLLTFLYSQFDYESNTLLGGTTTHTISTKITGSF